MTVVDARPTRSLDALETTIREGHAAVGAALIDAVEQAIAVGEALLEARAQVPRGTWTRWVSDRCELSMTTAAWYMRMAEYADHLRAERVQSLEQAKRLLIAAGADRSYAQGGRPRVPALAEAGRLVREQGLSVKEAAQLCGVDPRSVYYHARPEYRVRDRERERQKRAERKAREAREREQTIKRAARKAGGGIAEAYAMAERLQDVLGHAHAEATNREQRDELAQAGIAYRRMRDHIVRALGVS